MARPQTNPGTDTVALTFSRSTFNGGASASATSDPVTTNQYKKATLLLASTGAATLTASAAITYIPEWSSDGGTTWAMLREVNGNTMASFFHTPISGTPTQSAYIYPAAFPLFRLRISGAGAAASGISAAGALVLQQ